MKEQHERSSGLEFTLVNSVTNQPVAYSRETDALLCTLTNNTGSPIGFLSGGQPSKLEIFLPDFYQLDDLRKMLITLDGWDFQVNSDDVSLVLRCTKVGSWASGANLSFQITGAQSSEAPPQGGSTQINPAGMTGNNIPPQVPSDSPLTLQKKPDGQKPDLGQALDAGLENQGTIYISVNDNLLISNTLSLTLKNKGDQPLFPGSGPWPSDSHPQALVWFVYNDTAGALAPDDESTPTDQSAWHIQPGEIISEGNVWSFVPVDPKPKHPQWWLTPNATHPGILGTGDQASITFEFTHVVSHTPGGHTQMYLQCSGFPGYNDHRFVLDIDKRELPSPGLIRFTSTVNKITVHTPDDKMTIPFSWTMTGVSKIALDFHPAGLKLESFTKAYTGDQPPLQHDSHQLEFNGLQQSATLTVTCTAYDESGQQLNALPWSIDLDFPPTVTSYTGELQPDGNLLLSWTALGATRVTLNRRLSSETFDSPGSYSVPKPPLPFLHNDLYALTAMNEQGEKDSKVFTKFRKFSVLPAISIGGTPMAIAVSPDSSHVFVANKDDNNVCIVEVKPSNSQPFRVLPAPVVTGSLPRGIAVSPNGNYVFVINDESNSVTVFAGTPPFKPLSAPVPAGDAPICVAISPDGRYVFVTTRTSGKLSVIDTVNAPSFNVIQGPSLFPDFNPNRFALGGMAAAPDGHYIFVSDFNSHLWVVQIEAGANPPYRVLSPGLSVGASPRRVAVSPDGQYVFVVNDRDNTMSIIEVSSGPSFQVLSPSITIGPPHVDDGPYSSLTVSPDGSCLFVTGYDSVLVWGIDKNNHPPVQPLQTLSVGQQPSAVAASPDARYVFVANAGGGAGEDGTISVIQPVAVSM
jgi:DNA-binding beta-propeller fold protein YncE